jgi:dCMP deaminase
MLARTTSLRATCARRRVGCVLVSTRGHVLATGYNGVAAGQQHCNEGFLCAAARAASGQQLDGCEAIHAEQNALLQCRDPWQIETAYVTCAPCITCTKLLLNTSCQRIVFAQPYAHDTTARELWTRSGRAWDQRDDAITV